MAHIQIAAQKSARDDDAKLQITLANIASEREQRSNEAENTRIKNELDAKNQAIDLNNQAEISKAKADNEKAQINADANDKLVAQENKKQLDMLQHAGKMESIKNDHEVNLRRMQIEDKKINMENNLKLEQIKNEGERIRLDHKLQLEDCKQKSLLEREGQQIKHEFALKAAERAHLMQIKTMEINANNQKEERIRAIEDKKMDIEILQKKHQQEKNLADLRLGNQNQDLKFTNQADFFARTTNDLARDIERETAATNQQMEESKRIANELGNQSTQAEKRVSGTSRSSKASSASSSKKIESDANRTLEALFGPETPQTKSLARRYSKCSEAVRAPMEVLFGEVRKWMQSEVVNCRIERDEGCNCICILSAALTALQEGSLIADCCHDPNEPHMYLVKVENTSGGSTITEVRPNPTLPN